MSAIEPDVDEEKFPHYWQNLEALAHFDTEHLTSDFGTDTDGGAGHVGVGFSRGDVTVELSYYHGENAVDSESHKLSIGGLVRLTPDQARDMRRSLDRAIGVAEGQTDD